MRERERLHISYYWRLVTLGTLPTRVSEQPPVKSIIFHILAIFSRLCSEMLHCRSLLSINESSAATLAGWGETEQREDRNLILSQYQSIQICLDWPRYQSLGHPYCKYSNNNVFSAFFLLETEPWQEMRRKCFWKFLFKLILVSKTLFYNIAAISRLID